MIASIAARIVRPVKSTSSTRITSRPSTSNGMSVRCTSGREPNRQVVAVEADVERADRNLGALDLEDLRGEYLGERRPSGHDADEREVLRALVGLEDLVRDPGDGSRDRLRSPSRSPWFCTPPTHLRMQRCLPAVAARRHVIIVVRAAVRALLRYESAALASLTGLGLKVESESSATAAAGQGA